MISREDVALALETAYGDSYSPEGRAQHERAAGAVLALIQERIRELDAAWLRHTWPCGHISEGTGDEPDRCRICVAEARGRKAEGERDTWKDCIAEEMAENIKLFNLLGVMPEIEAGRAGTNAVVEAVRRLKADLAAALDALTQSASAVPVQRDERAEKLGEQLDAMVAEVNTSNRAVVRLEERARNAEALAANLRRVDNERAIELMRVRRELAALGDVVGRLVRASLKVSELGCGCTLTGDDYQEVYVAWQEMDAAANDPALAAWRGK